MDDQEFDKIMAAGRAEHERTINEINQTLEASQKMRRATYWILGVALVLMAASLVFNVLTILHR